MKRSVALCLLAGALTACGVATTPDTATMPLTNAGTPIMSDQGAIGLSSYVLGVPSRYVGHPVDAARALAGIEYLAGALYSNPRWVGIPAQTKQLTLQGRYEIRQLLAVPPDARSQWVVDGLIAASNALAGQDLAAAEKALPPNVFGLGPQRTIALLSNLPPLPAANVAAQDLNAATTLNCNFTANCG